MMRKPETEAQRLEMLRLNKAGYSYEEIAKKFGVSYDSAKSKIRSARLLVPAEFQVVSLGTPLDLVGDFIIVGDVHVPCTDWAFASLVGRVAEHTGINRLIIAGDFFNFDLWSSYRATVTPPAWRDERDAARVLIADWLETYSEIYTLQGNHERRLQKWVDGQFDEGDIWGMIATSKKMLHSNYGWCTVQSGGQTWRVTHPRNYGRNQLTVASDLAMKYSSNVITWHEHHSAIGWDVYGKYVTVNGGTLADPAKLAYVTLDDSRAPGMLNSFVVLKGGVAQVYGKYPFTDWGWLNDN
jgi:hypothetical protein